jgi:hypothetical protein
MGVKGSSTMKIKSRIFLRNAQNVFYQTTRRYIPEHSYLLRHRGSKFYKNSEGLKCPLIPWQHPQPFVGLGRVGVPAGCLLKLMCVSVRTHANDSTTDNQIFMKFGTTEICVNFGTNDIGTKFMTYKSSKTQSSKFNSTTLGIGLFN